MKKRQSLHGLGDLQAEVMEFVWPLGEATVSQVHEHILRKRDVTYTTVLVAMQKLEKKGWLTHRREGRAYVYAPRRSKEASHTGLLQEILKQVFQGDPQRLLSHLLDEHPMSDEELLELKRLIDSHRKEKRRE